MSTPSSPPLDAPPRRRVLRRVVLVLLAVGLLGVGFLAYVWYASDCMLREAKAEADRLDPGWRLADLEAARAEVPAEENSAFQIRAAQALLPTPWPPGVAAGGPPGLAEQIGL